MFFSFFNDTKQKKQINDFSIEWNPTMTPFLQKRISYIYKNSFCQSYKDLKETDMFSPDNKITKDKFYLNLIKEDLEDYKNRKDFDKKAIMHCLIINYQELPIGYASIDITYDNKVDCTDDCKPLTEAKIYLRQLVVEPIKPFDNSKTKPLGLGKLLINSIWEKFPGIRGTELETRHLYKGAHIFYTKLGFIEEPNLIKEKARQKWYTGFTHERTNRPLSFDESYFGINKFR